MCCSLNRRDFVSLTSISAAASAVLPVAAAPAIRTEWPPDLWDPRRPLISPGKPLRVQPVLMYTLPKRKEMNSWKSWGGIQTQEAVDKEVIRIADEWKSIIARADFPLELLPLIKVTNPDEAAAAGKADADVTVIYPATGSGTMLRAATPESGNAIIFVRHRSGPVYYWYESLSTRYLKPNRKTAAVAANAAPDPRRLSVEDVVIDDTDDVVWKLRAYYGIKNFLGTRIVALGGPQGKYAGEEAVRVARERFKLDIIDVKYADFESRIRSALADPKLVAQAEKWTTQYLALPGTVLDTERPFVVNSFLLYGAFKDILKEANATAFTINQCMGTIMPMSKTTACMTLSLLNDEGTLAFCESDFVIIPAGILLRHISRKPVFLHNSTFPHKGIITAAHCTGPRRMNGSRYEPVRLVTHYESEYGAAPKVEIPKGQELTFIDPEYATCRWVGIRGVVEDNPFYDICRSQQDVRILGNWRDLLNEVRDSHWVMVYGNYMREIAYAAPKIGVTWHAVSDAES